MRMSFADVNALGVVPRLTEETCVMNLLLVEDDSVLGKAISRGLTEAGHECTWERSGRRGLDQAASQQFDAVVLDLMLPDLSGQEVLAAIRSLGMRVPVMVLTAMSAVEDRVQGLKAGADDYLVKPFAFAELVARLEAICRRATDRPSSLLQVGPLTLNLTNRRVTRGDVELTLTPTEFSLLEFLMRYGGQVVTRKIQDSRARARSFASAAACSNRPRPSSRRHSLDGFAPMPARSAWRRQCRPETG